MATHYSKYLNVSHNDLVSKGVFNGFVDADSLLHVDPLLLKGCRIPEFVNSYSKFLAYFEKFVVLTKYVKEPKDTDRFFRQMVDRFSLKEIPNTGLGYSVGNTRGRGISGTLSTQLATSAYEIISAGLVDPEIFGMMQLLEDNIGADRISDMTISILQDDVLQYTERIAKELKLPCHRYGCQGKTYMVPFYNGKPMHFIPMCILADLPIAKEYDEIDDVCYYNTELKRRVARVIGVSWEQCKEYKKSQWRELILKTHECYREAINFYKNLIGVPYDFNRDNKNQYFDIHIAEFLGQHPLNYTIDPNIDIVSKVHNIAIAMCRQFKHLVENCRLSELLFRKGGIPDETDWQLMLYIVADTYRMAGNYDVAISREGNPGVGEIDFQITRGAKANTIIEIKRSENKNLLHGYRKQLAAYINADRGTSGIFIVIMEKDNIDEIKQEITTVQEDMRQHGEYIPEVIYINGMRQVSASNPRYENPSLL